MQDVPIPGRMPELDSAMRAAREAGSAVMEVYGGEFEVRTKEDDSPITEADLRSNGAIRGVLGGGPHPVLSEEDPDDPARLGAGAVWVVDPLDGTSDFVDRTGEFTVMIALVRGGVPVLGVIAWPAGGEFFAAQKGMGAFRFSGGRWSRISVTDVSDLRECRAVGSRHHLSERERGFIGRLGITSFVSIGSSLKVAKISSGEAEAYITTTDRMKEWDTAASHCIIGEAGGRMTDMLGNELVYNRRDVFHRNGILATNGRVHGRIVDEFAGTG